MFRDNCLLRETYGHMRVLVSQVCVSAMLLFRITVNLNVRCWPGFLLQKIRTVSCENPSSGPQVVIRHTCSIRAIHTYFFCLRLGGVGRVSSVGIATGYGLDGPGIESRRGRDFPHLSRPALGHTQPPVQWVPGLSRGKAAGAWCWQHTQSSAEVKERVELYLYFPSGSSWPVLGWTLPLPLPKSRRRTRSESRGLRMRSRARTQRRAFLETVTNHLFKAGSKIPLPMGSYMLILTEEFAVDLGSLRLGKPNVPYLWHVTCVLQWKNILGWSVVFCACKITQLLSAVF
jgi:hypothetical protein